MDYIYNPDSGELYHYGVKGMKWGVRKDIVTGAARAAARQIPGIAKDAGNKSLSRTKKTVVRKAIGRRGYSERTVRKYDKKIAKKVGKLDPKYDKNNAIQDYKQLGKKSVKRINSRLSDGQSYRQAYTMELGRRAAEDVSKKIARETMWNLTKGVAGAVLVKVGSDAAKYMMNRMMGVKALPDPNIIDLASDAWKILD